MLNGPSVSDIAAMAIFGLRTQSETKRNDKEANHFLPALTLDNISLELLTRIGTSKMIF